MEQKIVKMVQMSPKHAEQSIVQRIISNATIQNVFTNLLFVTVKMIVEMVVMSQLSMHVAHQTLCANLAIGLVLGFQMFVLTKERFAMTSQIVQMEQMKDLCVTTLIVIIIVVNVPMDVSKHLLVHFAHVLQVKC